MDNKENYPVLIHCCHGIGRAEMYSALYRIEYEKFTDETARQGVRTVIKYSSFDDGTPKGEWVPIQKRISKRKGIIIKVMKLKSSDWFLQAFYFKRELQLMCKFLIFNY
jgi:predicted protein tyrosine phosphatase